MNALQDYGNDDTDDSDDERAEKLPQKSSDNDFFNLNATESDNDNKPVLKNVKRKFVAGSDLQVEVPTTDFWDAVLPTDLKFKKADTHSNRSNVGSSATDTRNTTKHSSEKRARGNKTYDYWSQSYVECPHKQPKYCHSSGNEKHRDPTNIQCYSKKEENQNVAIESQKRFIHNKSSESTVTRKLYYIHPKVKPHLNFKSSFKIPFRLEKDICGHSGPVNGVKWNISMFSHLFLTVSMDSLIKVWNFWSGVTLDDCVQVLNVHTEAVKDGCWSTCGREIISCGYDKKVILSDVQTGKKLSVFQHDSYVNCVQNHPNNMNVFLSGSYNIIQAWDRRTPDRPVQEFSYKDKTGQVQDVIFSSDGSQVFSCCDLVSRDSADRNVMAWDFSSGVVLSNQIYQERYSCTRLQLHPKEGHFLAQTTGDYIAIFSTNKPYKLNKAKRFQGHQASGYTIGFDISLDGSLVVSGSSDGNAYFYDYYSGRLIRTIQTGLDVCTDVAVHPVLTNTVACCGWNGHIQVWS